MANRVTTEQDLINAANRVGEWKIAAAFKQNPFVYGTQGRGSEIVRGLKNWAHRPRRTAQQLRDAGYKNVKDDTAEGDNVRTSVLRELNLFDPGVRIAIYLSGNFQMMDMYYGQAGNNLHLKRNPAIGEFVHYAMGYAGPFSMSQPGRDAFQKTYKTSKEGWQWDDANIFNGSTATVEISRVIRWGIQRFGGKLIFEGKQVYYSQVFNLQGYKGDTDREAIALFKFFRPGVSSAAFGKGQISFYWNGVETVPTHCHFLSNWGFPASEKNERGKMSLWTRLGDQRASAAKRAGDIGALQHTRFNRGNITTWLESNAQLNKELWDNFLEKPTKLNHLSTESILDMFQKELALGVY
ncbi:MAG TPA: hypothetical protein VNM14_16435 [Planctomycetota bacterium]|nr:hypothetical protein [Planctomycetota bacterium]